MPTAETLAYIRAEIRRYKKSYATRFAPRCLQILDKRKQLVPLRLNEIQRAIGRAERKQLARRGKSRKYVLKGRQGGITTDQVHPK